MLAALYSVFLVQTYLDEFNYVIRLFLTKVFKVKTHFERHGSEYIEDRGNVRPSVSRDSGEVEDHYKKMRDFAEDANGSGDISN